MDKNHYLIELSESSKTDYGKRDFAEQRHEQKVFSAIWELESLVNNGGFRGYFGNNAETADFAPTALLAVGAHQCAAIVKEALALVPKPQPTDHDACWRIMHSLPEPVAAQFALLDDSFFAYPDNLTELLSPLSPHTRMSSGQLQQMTTTPKNAMAATPSARRYALHLVRVIANVRRLMQYL